MPKNRIRDIIPLMLATKANDKFKFQVGDIVKVTTRDVRDDKPHGTPFEGVIIFLRGQGVNRSFCVRKVASDKVSVERIFPLNSPYIQSVIVVKSTKTRRAKLYYLRNRKN